MSTPNSPQDQQQKTQVLVGIALAVLGLIFLLDNLHLFDARAILPFWPVVLIVVGVLKLSQSSSEPPSARLFAAALVLVGSLLTLRHLGIFDFRWRDGWPLLLIAAGVMVILNGRRRLEVSAQPAVVEPNSDARRISINAVLGGNQAQIDEQHFAGGDITVLMGAAELDLRRASMPHGASATVQLLVLMGGLKIKLPGDWSVSIMGRPVLGSIEDKSAAPLQPGKRLLISGDVVLGSVEISN
ncbi:cell wall-active antibiotics response protein [Paucibacter sp. B2R-40]|uniref:cell wall-active antibiotics response protein n=1 Tax=Paucibacter sp. B2R-40 TaxID=2893554 RepID=UPI0021E3EDC5|nr:cell wall-active antibiotics response protein [Paucibacter sp. B2R-40]MCV2353943.1 cell wall-active antibiotics response protein [Paucibacter sp. B2R-40]